MVLLEELRQNELGTSYFSLFEKQEHKVFLTYQWHTHKAFYYTLNDIIELENSNQSRIGTGNETHSAISFWFLALESYITTLLKLACLKKDLEFSSFKSQDIGRRLSSLIDLLELDRKAFNQHDIHGKINDFRSFRNELFHDRHLTEPIAYKKTMFSSIPILSSQVDTFQAILIFLEVARALRYAIPGIDSMPDALLRNNAYALWEKLDTCYEGILKPAFISSLKKHNITTALTLEIPEIQDFKSNVFIKGEVRSYITAEQESHFFVPTNDLVTHYTQETYQNFVNRYNLKPNTFRLAKMMTDNE